jgi:hypothetical protein
MLHWPWLENIGQDLRYALRMLARSPMFTAVAVVSLALGIGLNTAIFNVINALLLQSAPVAQPARLVALFNTGRSNGSLDSLGPPDYESYRDGAAAFESLAAHSSMDYSVRMGSVTESVLGELVSDNYFSTLGIHALLGRTFAPDSQGIVLSYGFWQRRLGGDPAVTSKTLTVAGTALPILGVAPRNFRVCNSTYLSPRTSGYRLASTKSPHPPGPTMDAGCTGSIARAV